MLEGSRCRVNEPAVLIVGQPAGDLDLVQHSGADHHRRQFRTLVRRKRFCALYCVKCPPLEIVQFAQLSKACSHFRKNVHEVVQHLFREWPPCRPSFSGGAFSKYRALDRRLVWRSKLPSTCFSTAGHTSVLDRIDRGTKLVSCRAGPNRCHGAASAPGRPHVTPDVPSQMSALRAKADLAVRGLFVCL